MSAWSDLRHVAIWCRCLSNTENNDSMKREMKVIPGDMTFVITSYSIHYTKLYDFRRRHITQNHKAEYQAKQQKQYCDNDADFRLHQCHVTGDHFHFVFHAVIVSYNFV